MGNAPEKDPALDGVVDGIPENVLVPMIAASSASYNGRDNWILTWSNGRVEDTVFKLPISDFRALDETMVAELKRLEAVKAQIIARRRLIKSVALGYINS